MEYVETHTFLLCGGNNYLNVTIFYAYLICDFADPHIWLGMN